MESGLITLIIMTVSIIVETCLSEIVYSCMGLIILTVIMLSVLQISAFMLLVLMMSVQRVPNQGTLSEVEDCG